MVCRAYKYRFYPSSDQAEQLARTFGCCRFVFNHFLGLRVEKWREEKRSVGYKECASLLAQLKMEYEWLKETSSVCLQQSLRHLEKAYSNFFQKRARFPKFKSKHRKQSAAYMKNAFSYRSGEITLAKQKEPLMIRWSRQFQGEPSSLTVTCDASGRYFISIHVEESLQPLPLKKAEVGLDLGLTHEVKDHRGQAILRPSFFQKGLERLQRLQRRLSRKKRGSKNSQKMRKQVARQHHRIRDRRLDFLHKLSWQLVNENQVIAVEKLAVKEMIQQKGLSRHIADAAWSTLLNFLNYKCQWYGKTLVQVDQYFPSSKLCSDCGFQMKEMPLSKRSWACPSCETQHDRDTNAARNILKEGMRLLGKGVPWGTRDFKPVECV